MSARERDILELIAQGRSDKEVARCLGISDLTARKHRNNMLKKTSAPNICALLYRAIQSGWLAVITSETEPLNPP